MDVFWRNEVNYSHLGSKPYDSKHTGFLNTISGFQLAAKYKTSFSIILLLPAFPIQRITIAEILEDEWFKKDYKYPVFNEKEDVNLDDVEAVFKDSEVSTLIINTNQNLQFRGKN